MDLSVARRPRTEHAMTRQSDGSLSPDLAPPTADRNSNALPASTRIGSHHAALAERRREIHAALRARAAGPLAPWMNINSRVRSPLALLTTRMWKEL